MSGFVGVISADDAPIDRRLLQQLTASLIYRGPDAQDLWIDGSVGFGHALLRTSSETECARQPQSLDGAVWITGDVRVDGRADLIRQLESAGRHRLQTASDAELILHAYDTWDEDCVKHTYSPGSTFFEAGRAASLLVKNESATTTVRVYGTFIVPVGATPLRIGSAHLCGIEE